MPCIQNIFNNKNLALHPKCLNRKLSLHPKLLTKTPFFAPQMFQQKSCSRAKRGDGTAKDGRKTERSSAPYAEAYSPRFCEYMFEFGLDKFLQKKNNTILIYIAIGQFTWRPVDAFDSAYVLPAMNIERISVKKATELKIQIKGNEQEWKESRKDMRRKQ